MINCECFKRPAFDYTKPAFGINLDFLEIDTDFLEINTDVFDPRNHLPGNGGTDLVPLDPFRIPETISKKVKAEIERSGDALFAQAAVNLSTTVTQLNEDIKSAVENAIATQDKANKDFTRNLVKAGDDYIDALRAVYHFAEREFKSKGDVLSNADMRLREAKFIDAFWHIGTEQISLTNMHANLATQESAWLDQAVQAAITAYSGPAGAAAYAAWKAYNLSNGDIGLALKAGVYAYALSAGGGKVSQMPTGTAGEVFKKAAVTGAMGGLAVAASGGSTEESLDAFVRSGGAVVVQAGQDYAQKKYVDPAAKNYFDPAKAKLDSFCMTASGMRCAEAEKLYYDTNERVKKLQSLKDISPTVVVTKGGDWSISWDKERIGRPRVNEPAIVVTYIGTGSPYRGLVNQIAGIIRPNKFELGDWAAFRWAGQDRSFFDDAVTGLNKTTPTVGDILVANRPVNLRNELGRFEDTNIVGVIPKGLRVRVVEVNIQTAYGRPQEFIRIGEP